MILARVRVDDALRAIVDRAEEEGVDLTVDVDADGSIWIGRIDRTHGSPGSGRRTIERLLELADDEDVDVGLACEEDALDLVSYYESLGFEVDSAGTSDNRAQDGHVVMTRSPE